jgi:squalene synthase HpnC
MTKLGFTGLGITGLGQTNAGCPLGSNHDVLRRSALPLICDWGQHTWGEIRMGKAPLRQVFELYGSLSTFDSSDTNKLIMVQNARSSNAERTVFLADLAKWGPASPPSACDLETAQAYCRRLARRHYENFTVVSWLLPKRLRQDFHNFYAYCRWSDDLADEAEPAQRLPLLLWWQQQLLLCFSGRPAHPVMVALQQTIERHQIPIEPLEDLLNAFRQDQIVTRYADRDSLLDYCRQSANPVGRVILKMARADSPENLELSDSICTGLQLANFCQDMARDAAMDRIYAPAELCAANGVTDAMVLAARVTPQLTSLLQSWVVETRSLFAAGRGLVRSVPNWLAMDIELFVRGGLAILDEIESSGFDVWTQRPTVSKLKKLTLFAGALMTRAQGFKA